MSLLGIIERKGEEEEEEMKRRRSVVDFDRWHKVGTADSLAPHEPPDEDNLEEVTSFLEQQTGLNWEMKKLDNFSPDYLSYEWVSTTPYEGAYFAIFLDDAWDGDGVDWLFRIEVDGESVEVDDENDCRRPTVREAIESAIDYVDEFTNRWSPHYKV